MNTWKPGDTAWIKTQKDKGRRMALPVTIKDVSPIYGLLVIMPHGHGAWFTCSEVYTHIPVGNNKHLRSA